MDEMLRYIFGTLRSSENTIRMIGKTMKKQRRSYLLFQTILVTHLIIKEYDLRNLRSRVNNLEAEVEELRITKGE